MGRRRRTGRYVYEDASGDGGCDDAAVGIHRVLSRTSSGRRSALGRDVPVADRRELRARGRRACEFSRRICVRASRSMCIICAALA